MSNQIDINSLYVEHRDELMAYAYHRVPDKSRQRAEEAVQETFANAIPHFRAREAVEHPRAFLFESLRNYIRSRFYRGRKNTLVDSLSTVPTVLAPRRFQTGHKIDIGQRLAVFAAGIDAVPNPKHREAFVRRRVYGESCKEISEAMNISEQAAMNYASLGWKSLKSYVERHGFSVEDFFEDAA